MANRWQRLIDHVNDRNIPENFPGYSKMDEVPKDILDIFVTIGELDLECCNKVRLLMDKAFVKGYEYGLTEYLLNED